MRALDPLYRLAFRVGFRAARQLWRLNPPFHEGALVALWAGERVLAVRQSYAPGWTLPGGGVQRRERPIDAAARELAEETRVRLPASSLRHALTVEHLWNFRRDRVHVFEARVDRPPEVQIDRRELVESRWLTLRELLELAPAPHLRDYGNSVQISQAASGEARR